MKIVVLSESKAMPGFASEHGLSYLIEVDQKKILFDTGASNLFLSNAKRLEIDLEEIDTVVLSHGHFDHGDGLQYLEGKRLICHPDCFVSRYRKHSSHYLGMAMTKKELEQKFELRVSREAVQLTEHLFFLGEVPRTNDFEAKSTSYSLEGGEDDFILDDSGLACITNTGILVISGCAHSGICNMIEHARSLTGIEEVRAVIGGFHLKTLDNQCLKTIECLKQKDIGSVFPSHCTTKPALDLFHDEFGPHDVIAGTEIVFH